jgi:rhamnosyltransferase
VGDVLRALGSQTVGPERIETIVVDSGSTDATVAIAQSHDVRLIEMPPEEFTYGRALNAGCQVASAPIVLALSAHAYPPDDGWLERMLAPLERERVACVTGAGDGPNGVTPSGPVLQDLELAREYPFWGYSNAAGAFRADLWSQRPFREDMPFAEDKEWAWYWLNRGWLVELDPALDTHHDHSGDSVLTSYRRARAAYRGFAMFVDVPPVRLRDKFDEQVRKRKWRNAVRAGKWAGLAGQYLERRALNRR